MKLTDFVAQTEFSSGLPQGDTFFDLETVETEPVERKGNDGKITTSYSLTKITGEKYFVPKTVMAKIKELVAKRAKKIRITRNGFQLDTTYAVVRVD